MLYWDLDTLPEIRGGRAMDRIAVLVTGYGKEKLMNDTGDAGPTSVDLVHEHKLPERMKGLSLNT